MARPLKQGLDYFPMDVDMDDKIELVEAKHDLVGFGIVVKLFQRIYKEGYFLQVTDDFLLLFSKRVNVSINKVTEVINDCLCYDIFDKKLHKKYKILTSSGIQKRYFKAIERRKEISLDKNIVIVNINGINANINWINTFSSTQSKVKERKEEESIEGEASSPEFINKNFEKIWNEWKDYRKKIKKPIKPVSEQKAYDKLIEIANNSPAAAQKIIDQSIANSWQGLFELKADVIQKDKYKRFPKDPNYYDREPKTNN